jgi:chemotaxis protein methyltransferase CheR
MKDPECVAFLQWALPRLALRWAGYRKVRRQVCRRLQRRLAELGLAGPAGYRDYLDVHPDEWPRLEALCPITISSFYRDRAVWDFLVSAVLPRLAREAAARGRKMLHALSLGCASGEEPYTLMLAWRFAVEPQTPGLTLRVAATDVAAAVLERARLACYGAGSLKLLPARWREQAFERADTRYCLHPEYRRGVEFRRQDIRTTLPEGMFDAILCRNLVFTYFEEALQRRLLSGVLARLAPGGAFVIGRRETLSAETPGLVPWPGAERLNIYRFTP